MSGSLRITFLAGPLEAGAANVSILDLAVALRRLGHEVSVLAGRGPLEARFREAEVPLDALEISGSFLPDVPRLGDLKRAAKARAPELIHVADVRLWRHGRALARLLRCPCLVSLSEPGAPRPGRSPWIRTLIVPGRAARDACLAPGDGTAAPLRIVPPGVDSSRYPDPVPPFGDGRPIVGAVTRLVREAGLERLLSAARRLLGAGRELHLLVSGHGPRAQPLRRLARELGIASHVTVTALPADLERVLASLDVFVHPVDREWSGGEILQAMAAARPVVASGVGQALSLVREGETGNLVARGSEEELAERIGRLLDDPERAAEMGRSGREAARRSHPIEHTAREMEAVCLEAMEER